MSRVKTPVYSFDFETVVNQEKTRVWLWGAVNLEDEHFEWGSDLDSFVKKFSTFKCRGSFHNLKFDIQFLFYWLFHHGYKHTSERHPGKGYFTTLISDMGMFYSVKIHWFEGGVMELTDSLKLIPMPVADMPKAFGLDIEKLEIDYDVVQDENHVPTEKEIKYVQHDCLIVARAVNAMRQNGMSKMTAASNALNQFKGTVTKDEFEWRFPQLPLSVDKDCRHSYKGGWTYLNPKYKDKMLDKGQVYDVNSMYPWAMKYCELPWGVPEYYYGEPQPTKDFPLFIHCFECEFKLKPGMYPSVQIKGSSRFVETEYLTESDGIPVLLYMTNVDYQLMCDTYDMFHVKHHGGYRFRSQTGMFADYIDYWYGQKSECKHNGNYAMYYVAKLMLNSLYGKFGSNPEKRQKYPYLDEEQDIVRYEYGAYEEGKTAYVPIASFITSNCRNKIIRTAIACGDRFVYADTDSVHIEGLDIPDIDIDEYRLGAFKCESVFDRAKFHRSKCYIEEIDGKLDKKCAGLPKSARAEFSFETMEPGAIFQGKLVPKNIKGGTVLVERDFTIK